MMAAHDQADGSINPSYAGPREDLLRLLPLDCRNILDLGCSTGEFGRSIKQRQQARVTGVELDPSAAQQASEVLDTVHQADAEDAAFREILAGADFDAVLCGDILEHLRKPEELLLFLADKATTRDAVFLISLPNVGHWSTLYNVWMKGHWPRNDRGIHDRTHLRWYTVRDAIDLAESARLKVELVREKPRLMETIHPWNGGWTERILYRLFGNLLVHQVLLRARKV